MGADPRTDLDAADSDVTYCARHPQVETGLRCGRCETPICPRCLVQTPVGARCRDCANVRTIPTLDVSPVFLVRGVAGAAVAGAVTGTIWGFISGGRGGFLGFFIIFIAMGIAYCVAEAVSLATNRKRGRALQWVAASGVILAYLVRNVVAYDALFVQGDIWGMLAAGFGAFWAYQRIISN